MTWVRKIAAVCNGVNHKPWRQTNQQGYTVYQRQFGAGWDSSQMQSQDAGCFTVFGGGHFGDYLVRQKKLRWRKNCIRSLDGYLFGR